VLARVDVQHAQGFLVAVDDPVVGNHFADNHAGAEFLADFSKSHVGNASHRRHHHPVGDFDFTYLPSSVHCHLFPFNNYNFIS